MAFFGELIATKAVPNIVYGGLAEAFPGIAAERKTLEEIAAPLSAVTLVQERAT